MSCVWFLEQWCFLQGYLKISHSLSFFIFFKPKLRFCDSDNCHYDIDNFLMFFISVFFRTSALPILRRLTVDNSRIVMQLIVG